MRNRMLRTGATALGLAFLIGGCTGAATTPSWTMAPGSDAAASAAPIPATAPSPSAATAATITVVECDCPCASPSAVAYPGLPVASVTLHGSFFTRAYEAPDIRRGKGLVVAPETLVDGVFLDRFQQWDEGAVWWETDPALAGPGTRAEAAADRPWIEIALDGTHEIDAAIVQGDNNDTYLLSYRDVATGEWKELWQVPPDYSFGMVTRPNQMDDTARMTFGTAVTTDALRLEAIEGDAMYSISEVQLFGKPPTD